MGFAPASALVATRSRRFAPGRPGPGAARASDGVVPGAVAPVGSPAVACVIAIDAGTTGVRALAVDESGAVVDVSYRELTQHYPRPGWVEHDPVEIWDTVVDHGRRRWPSAGTTAGQHGGRHRHHQPARDGGGLGPGHGPARCTGPSCGRTGAPPSAATSCAPRAISPWCASAPGSSSTPTSRAPRWSGSSGPGGVAVTDDLVLGDRRRLVDLEPDRRDRRRGPRHRRHQRLAHLALRHPRAGRGPTSCATSSACPAPRSPTCTPRAGASAWCGARSATRRRRWPACP